MADRDEWLRKLKSIKRLNGMDDSTALQMVCWLADFANEAMDTDASRHAVALLDSYLERDLPPEYRFHAYYSKGTSWADLYAHSTPRVNNQISKLEREIDNTDDPAEITKLDTELERLRSAAWDPDELAASILSLRRAYLASKDIGIEPEAKCRLLTNLGNQLDHAGRFIEAIDYWDRALTLKPTFAMAIGNKGMGIYHYGGMLYDRGHQALFAYHAYRCLKLANQLGAPPHAEPGFRAIAERLRAAYPAEFFEADDVFELYPLGTSPGESHYRMWCLRNRLFINPLNDLGHYSAAAQDVMSTPPIVTSLDEGPHFQGLFNQLKQEFVSARYIFYEAGMDNARGETHFSDRDTYLLNTLDYPSYSLATEKEKLSYRVAYSLLDKIGFFLNEYFRLGINKVYFSNLWYANPSNRKMGIKPQLLEAKNSGLLALFWLSKDIFTDDEEAQAVLEPEARELRVIRNELEHNYLKLVWLDRGKSGRVDDVGVDHDALAYYMRHSDFQEKTLRLLKTARAALIYLSAAVHREERRREGLRDPQAGVPSMPLDIFEDDWKR